jgi:hypothetical protein
MQRTMVVSAVALFAIATACNDGPRDPVSPDSSLRAAAQSGNAHFIKSGTSATRSGDLLNITFKEAGLASGSVETIVVSGTGTATFQCINGGGNNPSAANKTTVSSQVTNSGTFTANQSGNVTGSLSLSPPGPGGFTCPPGQTLSGPLNVSYTNVAINDQTSGASFSFTGTF